MSRVWVLSDFLTQLTYDTKTYHNRPMTHAPIDVQKLLGELWSAGISDATIGKSVGAPTATINRLRNGIHKSTKVERAIRIANYHAERQKKKSASA